MAYSNLESFLKCATPAVRTQFLPKVTMIFPSPLFSFVVAPGRDSIGYFVLEDLWDCYDEWSAYGVGAPIRLNGHETVVQYYTPYLSALQIYTGKSLDLSSDNEEGRLSRTNSISSNRMWDSDDSGTDQDTELKIKKPLGKLYCQYFDHSSPHQRLPISGLNSLRSIDLSPASWMAVAWYPIYHLPSQRNPKELYSAFLTYHSLCSSFEEGLKTRETGGTTALPPFGLATYRMQRRVWVKPGTEDSQKISSLLSAASSWLTQVDAIHHPDFGFFVSRSM
ncbi:unnamed protein product [Spirodela intermedia]|uniref:Uncharacterized protein n=1 Tax=Spirodela intermedia TaxID=51605 RepID=A0A7I8JAY7_SPIIN|nr:unnamed protein product [Spirodela intermedia]CAA6666603.1 unnamed protein product [Spirodela intermedia]